MIWSRVKKTAGMAYRGFLLNRSLKKVQRRFRKMRTPILLADLIRAAEKLPDPETFKESNFSVKVTDTITGEIRDLLFMKKSSVVREKKEQHWTVWADVVMSPIAKNKAKHIK